jgi:hypothetical protein
VVGRNQKENQDLLTLAKDSDYIFNPYDTAGPTGLLRTKKKDYLQLGASIVSRYCDSNGNIKAKIVYSRVGFTEGNLIESYPIQKDVLESLRI